MAKQCPLKLAAAITHTSFDDIYRLNAEGDCLCNEVECGWWSKDSSQCAVLDIPGSIRDAAYNIECAINRK